MDDDRVLAAHRRVEVDNCATSIGLDRAVQSVAVRVIIARLAAEESKPAVERSPGDTVTGPPPTRTLPVPPSTRIVPDPATIELDDCNSPVPLLKCIVLLIAPPINSAFELDPK